MLVNNAALGYLAAIEEGEEQTIRMLFDTNVFGVASTIRAVLPGMRAAPRLTGRCGERGGDRAAD